MTIEHTLNKPPGSLKRLSRPKRSSRPALGQFSWALLFSLSLLPLGLGLVGCSSEVPSRTLDATVDLRVEPFELTIKTALVQTAADSSSASGSLRALRRATPGTKLMGRVETVAALEGQRVTRGQLLARLESRDLQAAIEQAEAGLVMAQAQLQNASTNEERMTTLHKRGSVTDKNVEDAIAQLRVTEAGVKSAEANLEAAKVFLGYAEIRSPLNGWVTKKFLHEGDMAAPGAPAFEVEDLSTLEVIAEVSESQLPGLRIGLPVTVEVAGTKLNAEILRIVPSGDTASRTFTVKSELPNVDGTLRSGMFARVKWSAATATDSGFSQVGVKIERNAVTRKGQLEGLFVANPETNLVELRWVKTGTTSDGFITILSGLSSEELYVVDPPMGLFDGAPYVAAPTGSTL